jgi:hypothetical protein
VLGGKSSARMEKQQKRRKQKIGRGGFMVTVLFISLIRVLHEIKKA